MENEKGKQGKTREINKKFNNIKENSIPTC